MATIEENFKQSQENVKELKSRPSDSQLLQLYSLYKQATVGDVNGKRPGMLAMKERAKFDAWTKVKGIDANSAMEKYNSLVESLVGKQG